MKTDSQTHNGPALAVASGSPLFPIMEDYDHATRYTSKPTKIPWALLAPHGAQAGENHSQSLATLARRGGLSPTEACAIIEDRDWRKMGVREAEEKLAEHVRAFLANTVVSHAASEPRPLAPSKPVGTTRPR